MIKKPVIGIVGSGNTAWCLTEAFLKAGYPIAGVAPRNKKTGLALSRKHKVEILDIHHLAIACDLLFLCVQDRYIQEISNEMHSGKAALIHCSGSASIQEIKTDGRGVFYPVISMRFGRSFSFEKVPICIEADSRKLSKTLKQLATDIHARPEIMNSEKRLQLHIAAVFVNNFSNACFLAAEEITKANKIPFALLQPLLLESLERMLKHSPREVQTGPARRNDQVILKKHLRLLKELPAERKMYKAISDFILEQYN